MSSSIIANQIVDIDWGLDTIARRVLQVYGPAHRRQVTIELTPELGSHVVGEPTTVTLPCAAVHQGP